LTYASTMIADVLGEIDEAGEIILDPAGQE
jgi:hypothetical protein